VVTKRIALLLLLATGCVSEAKDAVQDVPPAPAEVDAGAEGPAEDASPPPPPSPIVDWSFEPASADCNGWPVVGADAIRASPARSGSYSCKVCSNGSTAGLALERDLESVPPGRYVLTAWVRRRPQNDAPAQAVAKIDTDGPSGAIHVAAPAVAVREEWDRLETTIDLGQQGASKMRVTIGADSAAENNCLFIDDVTLVRTP
jgi:hypothetical protein